MTYQVIIPPIVQKQLEKLDRNVRERILASLERIRVRPYDFVEKITGYRWFKLRVGDYRVVVDIQNDKLVIVAVRIGHRKSIYKGL